MACILPRAYNYCKPALMPLQYAEIVENLSANRLKTYRTRLCTVNNGLPTPEAVKAYFLLNDISQHFFVPLQLVEVALRNRIHLHVTASKGKARWYESVPATVKTKDAVARAKSLATEEVAQPTPDDIVCRLTFGFWANLLEAPHRDTAKPDHFIWDQHGFKKVFRGAPAGLRVAVVADRMKRLSTLRNRLFHHEPIWNSKKVTSVASAIGTMEHHYSDLLEVLDWISPEHGGLLRAWSFPGRLAKACDETRFDRSLCGDRRYGRGPGRSLGFDARLPLFESRP